MTFLEKRFQLTARHSTLRREITGGVTTYAAMAYILAVQPIVLSAAGMDFGAVLTATALASALACFIMGFWANYPIALAPAMGHNFYFAFAVVLGMGMSWQAALGATFMAGIIFLLLTLAGMRQKVLNALPSSLMNAIGTGIGMLIALVGLEWMGVIVDAPGTLVKLGDFHAAPVLLSLAGLTITSILLVRKIPGALILGILATALMGIFSGIIEFHGLFSAPPSIAPTAFSFDLSLFTSLEFWVVVLVLLFLDIFDTIGTLVGIAPEAEMMKGGKPDISNRAFMADAGGTIVGSLLGTSTVTSYVESASGIHAGARTGLAAVVTGVLLLLSPFLYPLVKTIAGGVSVSDTLTLYPVTAPVLVIIGVYMMKRTLQIAWDDLAEAIPAFLTIVIMMLSVSITDGIAFGIIAYSILAVAGRKKVSWVLHLCALLLLGRYLFLI